MAKNSVVFLVFGVDEVFNECHYFFLRYLATRDEASEPVRFVVFTDRMNEFDRWREHGVEIETVHTPMSRLEEWYGPQKYFWRAKIMMIREFLDRFGGNGIYCDSDTYPRRDLNGLFDRIEAGDLFMYEDEGCYDKRQYPEFWRYDQYLRKHPTVTVGTRTYEIPLTTRAWNAGVIGLSEQNAGVMDEVLAVTDQLYSEWGHALIEQLSVSYCFQNSPQGCQPAAEDIFHYWPVRRFALLAERFFARHEGADLETLIADSERILPEQLAPKQQSFDEARPFQWAWQRYPARMQKVFPKYARWPIEDHFDLAEPATRPTGS